MNLKTARDSQGKLFLDIVPSSSAYMLLARCVDFFEEDFFIFRFVSNAAGMPSVI